MSGTKAGAAKRPQTQPVPSVTQEGRAESRPDPVLAPEVMQEFIDLGAKHGPSHPVYVVPPRRVLLHQGKTLKAGEVVEGAHLWPRVETWVSTGRIELQK